MVDSDNREFNVVNVTADITPDVMEILSGIHDTLRSMLSMLDLIHDDVHVEALGGRARGVQPTHPR